jgi:hypothetical protein
VKVEVDMVKCVLQNKNAPENINVEEFKKKTKNANMIINVVTIYTVKS